MSRKGTAREVFIDEVLDIYMKEGLRTTMDVVSKRLKISKRTIYEQFKDKTDVVRACVLRMQEQMPPYVDVEHGNVVPYLFNLLDEHVRLMHGERARFILNLRTEYPELYLELFKPLLQQSKDKLFSALKEGELYGYVRPGFDHELLFSYLIKFVYLVTADKDEVLKSHSLDMIFEHSLTPLLRGLLTEKGVKALDAMASDKNK